MSTIPGVLFAQAIKQPNALAIEDLGWSLSYAELAEKVRKAAAVLGQMGLSRGDKFAVWAPNCAEWIIKFSMTATIANYYYVLQIRQIIFINQTWVIIT